MFDSLLDIVLSAIALLLVMEGIMPFLSPARFRSLMLRISQQSDKTLRIMGLITMVAGALLMYVVHFGLFDRLVC